MNRKSLHAPIVVLLLSFLGAGFAAAADESGKPAPARKVLVIAKIKEGATRSSLEKAVAAELKKRGVDTTLGSEVMTEEDFVSLEAVRKKVESLDVEGVIGYVPLGIDETVKTSSVSVGIGIGGYSAGGMGMFVGGSVPVGGSTKVVRKVRVRVRYFAKPYADAAWEKSYNETLKDDRAPLIDYLARDSVGALKKKKLIPAK